MFEGFFLGLKHAVEAFGLGDGAREAIQDKSERCQRGRGGHGGVAGTILPIGAISVSIELVLDHVDHDIVADQATLIHDLFCFPTKRSLFGDLSS